MRREKGVALVIALLVVAAAAVLAISMADRGRRSAVGTVSDRITAAAAAAARGGVERARWALANDEEYAGERLTIGDADVVIEVERGHGSARSVRVRATTSGAPFAETVTGRVDATLALQNGALPAVLAWSE